ncbi:hypothetical protein M0Q28_07065 [Patescibacteria group bacterium]|jgi:hypothetical protein|nr:hypothetical protein [Patescibacteria group bacterium]
MKASQLIESKYLKKEDAGDGLLVTVRYFKKENVGREDEQEMKWVIHFDECKPMVLNSTNIALIEKALGTDETDDWIGQKIVLFNDENVSFGGKVTGGVRVDMNRTKKYHAKSVASKAEGAKPAPVRSAGQQLEDMEDDIPF